MLSFRCFPLSSSAWPKRHLEGGKCSHSYGTGWSEYWPTAGFCFTQWALTGGSGCAALTHVDWDIGLCFYWILLATSSNSMLTWVSVGPLGLSTFPTHPGTQEAPYKRTSPIVSGSRSRLCLSTPLLCLSVTPERSFGTQFLFPSAVSFISDLKLPYGRLRLKSSFALAPESRVNLLTPSGVLGLALQKWSESTPRRSWAA